MPKNYKHSLRLYLCFLFFLAPLAKTDNRTCDARTEQETIFCELKSRGVRSLPSLSDFRKNSESIQLLLLKKPAAAYGIALPDTIKKEAADNENQEQTAEKDNKPVTTIVEKNFVETMPRSPEQISSFEDSAQASGEPDYSMTADKSYFVRCSFLKDEIRCSDAVWKRMFNQAKRRLAEGALDERNVLQLASAVPTGTDQLSDMQYLQRTYPVYLQAMLRIGLADNTISFTKFHNIFKHLKQDRSIFERRFYEMYEYLKQDRQTLMVKKASKKSFQGQAGQCTTYPAHAGFVSCDNVVSNWLFEKQY